MPGVIVTAGAVAGPSTPTSAPSGTYFVAGQAERGPADGPQLVTNLAEFRTYFGEQTTYGAIYDDVAMYFQEGGSRAYVTRVVGGDATTGALAAPLDDRAVAPVSTLSVTASSPGAWAASVSVTVIDGAATDTFRIRVFRDGDLVEDFPNLHSPAEAVSKVNAKSTYIRLTNLASATAAPDNNPAAVGPLTLTAGTDDRAAIVAADYVAALDRFGKDLGDGAVAIPGIGSAVHAGLVAHATVFNRLALLSAAQGSDVATLIGYAEAADAQRAGLFAPWVRIPDGYGGTRAISPEGFVAAARAKAHQLSGPWRAAAGEISRASYAVAPDEVFTVTEMTTLDESGVNVIRTIASTVRLYGWRSTSSDVENWAYLTGADVVNRVVVEAQKRLEQYVFGVIDSSGHLLSVVHGTLVGIVLPMASAGGLFAHYDIDGNQTDPGYAVRSDASINSVDSLALNQVLAEVTIRPAPTAALVRITVTKAAVTASL
jgi:hypothetical protein